MARRLAEGSGPYRAEFEARLRLLEQLFRKTNDLRHLLPGGKFSLANWPSPLWC